MKNVLLNKNPSKSRVNLLFLLAATLLAPLASAQAIEATPVDQALMSDTLPATAKVNLGDRYDTYGLTIVRQRDGNYAISVVIQAERRHPVGHGPNPNVESVDFVPVTGTLHREGGQLLWSAAGRELVVGSYGGFFKGWVMDKGIHYSVNLQRVGFGTYWVSLKMGPALLSSKH